MSHSTVIIKQRKPWVAGILSLLVPGLGHIYIGKWKKGLFLLPLFILAWYFLALPITIWVPGAPLNVILMAIIIIVLLGWPTADAVYLAKQYPEGYHLEAYDKWFIYLLVYLFAIMGYHQLSEIVGNHLWKPNKLVSTSMQPTLLLGDHILTDKIFYSFHTPQRGDIITFRSPEDENKIWIKRIIGLPGETIEVREKMVYLNGELLEENSFTQHLDPGTIDGELSPRDYLRPQMILPNTFFVMGDNRDQSLDSRFWGFLEKDKITGYVKVIYWSSVNPFSATQIRWGRIGHWVQ